MVVVQRDNGLVIYTAPHVFFFHFRVAYINCHFLGDR